MKVKTYIRGKSIWIEYTIDHERFRKSTGLKDTAENHRILQEEIIPQLIEALGTKKQKNATGFEFFYKKFLSDKESNKSFNRAKYTYNKVYEHFRSYEVTQITRRMVLEYINSLDVKNATKKEYIGCIKGILDIAVDSEVVERNVAEGIVLKRESKVEINPFSASEVELILSKADGMLKNYLAIGFFTGLRSGEILGLMHSDIHEDYISIKRSISKGVISTPKTIGSIRKIPIMDAVRPYIKDQVKTSKSLFLFELDGRHLLDVSYFKRRWKQLLQDCGIEYRKIYTTRHTFITAMLNSGEYKIMEIAAIVGHTSAEMIMKSYAGFIKNEHLEIDTSVDIFKKKEKKSLTYSAQLWHNSDTTLAQVVS
ncbi:MAG: tyrosine-type recombinase/integrase [Sulfurimonadaceae bacterium]